MASSNIHTQQPILLSSEEQLSDISGLSELNRDATDTFDRRMAEQVRTQQLLRNAAQAQQPLLFGRRQHGGKATLRSALESVDAGDGLRQGAAAAAATTTTDIQGQVDAQDTNQWGNKGSRGAVPFRRVHSGAAASRPRRRSDRRGDEDIPAGREEYKSGFTRTRTTGQRSASGGDVRTRQRSYEDPLAEIMSLEQDAAIEPDSPTSLRSKRRRQHVYQRQSEPEVSSRHEIGRRKSLEERFSALHRPRSQPDVKDAPRINNKLSPGGDSASLLRDLARAASQSPVVLPSKTIVMDQGTDSNKEEEKYHIHQPETQPRSQTKEAEERLPKVKVEEVETEPAKTPKVLGGWIDTPAPVRHGNMVAEPTVDSKTQPIDALPISNSNDQLQTQPKKPASHTNALETLLEKAQTSTRGIGHAARSVLNNLTGPNPDLAKLKKLDPDILKLVIQLAEVASDSDEQQMKELKGLGDRAKEINASRAAMRDASKEMKRLEQEIEREQALASKPVLVQHVRLTQILKSELLVLSTYFITWPERSPPRLTWLGIFTLTAMIWAVSEMTLCGYYCHPQFAYSMDGYGVDIHAPRMPLVTATLFFRPLAWAGLFISQLLSWMAQQVVELAQAVGAAAMAATAGKATTIHRPPRAAATSRTPVAVTYEWTDWQQNGDVS